MLSCIAKQKLLHVGEQRNFLRKRPELIYELKNIFGDLPDKELNYLINHHKHFCICGNPTKFDNHEHGYNEHCAGCTNDIKRKKISAKLTNRKIKSICPKCNISETHNGAICLECNSKFKCVHCKDDVLIADMSENINIAKVCNKCEYDYFINSKLSKVSYVKFKQYSKCKHCDELFENNKGGYEQEYCVKHRRECVVCGVRFEGQFKLKTCSPQCNKELHITTNMLNYGVKHNLLIKGSKKSHIEYWLNKGLTYEESIFEVYRYQGKYKTAFNSLDEINMFFKENEELYMIYSKDICIKLLLQSDSLIKLFNSYIETNNITFGDESIIFKPNTFGTIIHIKYNDNVITLRSKKEFYFYSILIKNNIKFKTNQRYNNSDLFYDFYLIDYDKYIEITGFMNDDVYIKKMKFKEFTFNSILLNTYKEMKQFIKGLNDESNIS